MLASVASNKKQGLSLGLLLTTRQLVCCLGDNCQKKFHIKTAKYLIKHVVDTFETHLKVGQNHFSIHVAIAAFGGHGDDWRKAIPLPLVLVASRLKERHKLFIIKLLRGVNNQKVGDLQLLKFVRIQMDINDVKNCCNHLLSHIIILTHCFYG